MMRIKEQRICDASFYNIYWEFNLNYEKFLFGRLCDSICMALLVARVGLVLWLDYVLVVHSLGTESGTVLCLGYGMLVWPVIAECVAWL